MNLGQKKAPRGTLNIHLTKGAEVNEVAVRNYPVGVFRGSVLNALQQRLKWHASLPGSIAKQGKQRPTETTAG